MHFSASEMFTGAPQTTDLPGLLSARRSRKEFAIGRKELASIAQGAGAVRLLGDELPMRFYTRELCRITGQEWTNKEFDAAGELMSAGQALRFSGLSKREFKAAREAGLLGTPWRSKKGYYFYWKRSVASFLHFDYSPRTLKEAAYRIRDVAAILGVTRRTIQEMFTRGDLIAINASTLFPGKWQRRSGPDDVLIRARELAKLAGFTWDCRKFNDLPEELLQKELKSIVPLSGRKARGLAWAKCSGTRSRAFSKDTLRGLLSVPIDEQSLSRSVQHIVEMRERCLRTLISVAQGTETVERFYLTFSHFVESWANGIYDSMQFEATRPGWARPTACDDLLLPFDDPRKQAICARIFQDCLNELVSRKVLRAQELLECGIEIRAIKAGRSG
jgi:hypothetical protein